jgi:4,5:9,10-diseco-3-hydroxy-5,9,17-trioxoandrosta-1(10),2-diene-4-oate hydrolase
MNLRAAAGVPADAATVEVDGVHLAVARTGRGPAVVCLHAVGHGGGDFAAFAAALGAGFDLIRIDWPGQGRSGDDAQPPTPERYAALLAGVLEQLGVERPILVGCSIGGAAALVYAQHHPARALVLCNSGGLLPVTAAVRLACGWFARIFAAGARGAWWYKSLWAAYYRFLVLPSPAAAAQRQRIIAAGYETAGVLRGAWSGFGRPEADLRQLAALLEVPVWIAWAEGDRIIPLARCMPAIRQMRQASVSRFGGGHAAFLEQPEAFTRGFLAFCVRIGVVAAPGAEPHTRTPDLRAA